MSLRIGAQPRPGRRRRIGAVASLLTMALLAPIANLPRAAAANGVPVFDHIFVIVLENHSYNEIIGNSAAPYLNSLANQYGLATQYHVIGHPSLPNYLALSGGGTFGITTDCNTCYVSSPNIAVDRVEASGRTWKAYMESMPANCTLGDTSLYVQHHDPFVYYDDIRTNPTECNKVVPYTNLATDLASTSTTPNYGWITPNLCNDMHNCSVATGDAWMQANVPSILSSPAFTTQNSLLAVVFDEDDGSQGNLVSTILAGPSVNPGFRSSVAYDHYSLLKTIETAWSLAPLTTNDANAAAMTDFFTPPLVFASDSFTRTVANGWGTADLGGPWTLGTAASNYQVNGSAGTMSLGTVGATVHARLLSQLIGDADLYVRLSADKAATGNGQWGALVARRVSSGNEYRIRVRFMANNAVGLSTSKVVGGVETLVGSEVVVPGLTYVPNTFYDVHALVSGTNPTTIRARAWLDGQTEPSTWQLTQTDSTAAMQNPGAPGLWSYLAGNATNAPVTFAFDDLTVLRPAVAPTANFTVSCTNLTCNVDGTSSTTQQPPLTYAWNWGDGTNTAGATSSHTYGAAATYTITLTVTDNGGLQGSTSQPVSPTNAPPVYASDTFTRTLANSWGTADIGGAWTLGTAASAYQVTGTAGTMALSTAGATAHARLLAQSLGDVDLTTRMSADKAATGNGQWGALVARRVSTGNEYRIRLRFMANNAIGLSISKVVGNVETLVGSEVVVSGLTYAPNTFYDLRAQVVGTNPTTIRAHAWLDGQTEPATWQLTQTDATAALQSPGVPGLWSYLAGNSTSAPVTLTFDDFVAHP